MAGVLDMFRGRSSSQHDEEQDLDDAAEEAVNPGGSQLVFGSLTEEDSLIALNSSFEEGEERGPLLSPTRRRLSAATTMRKLSKLKRAMSKSLGDETGVDPVAFGEEYGDDEDDGEAGELEMPPPSPPVAFSVEEGPRSRGRSGAILDSTSSGDGRDEDEEEAGIRRTTVGEATVNDVTGFRVDDGRGGEEGGTEGGDVGDVSELGKGLAVVDDTPSRPIREASEGSSTEDVNDPAWIQHRKHVFILSEAGKPIYCRHGTEDKLVTLMGVMQALVSFVEDDNDSIRSIHTSSHKIVFMTKGPLLLVIVANTQESTSQLTIQLNLVFQQVLSVLTYTQLVRIFQQRRNYDLRRLLSGTEKFIDNLLNLMDHEPSILLGAVRCLPLAAGVRDTIGNILQQCRSKDVVFAILVAENQLITLLRPKRHSLYPQDLYLVFNLVDANPSFRNAESWTPICLPKFDNSGYLHAHVSYLGDDDCPACLLLLSTNKDMFFSLSECRNNILEKMEKQNCLKAIKKSLARQNYEIGEVGIPDLRHFMYESKNTRQYTSPEIGHPYSDEKDRERLLGLYQYLHHRIHSSRPLKILFHVGSKETVLGWVTAGFELYAVFGPLVTKNVAISSVNKLLRWIKREEDRLFILSSQTY